MSRRRFLFPVLVLALFAASCPAALAAYGPLWSQPVAGAAQLVAGDAGVTVVWAVADGIGSALVAQRCDRAGEPLGSEPTVLVGGITGLSDWLATSDGGSGVVVAWKAGGLTAVRRVAASGAGVYAPVRVCSDAAVTALRRSGATAAPVQLEPDGFGGVYVRLLATPSRASGDTLLNYVSPLAEVARPDPGLAVVKGTIAGMSADSLGHLFVLLSGPGRNGVAAQRFAADLKTDWAKPIGPYNPLLGSPPATPQTPVGIVATISATTAWKEGSKVKVQRFSAAGDRLWLRPAAVSASGAPLLAGDAWGGCYLAGASADGLRVQHIAGDGVPVGDPAGSVLRLGLGAPRVDDVSWDRAGDLAVAYGDGGASAGVARMSYLGTWSSPDLSPIPTELGALGADGAGGDYALGEGAGARLWGLGEAGAALTLRPRASKIAYGGTGGVAGYLTSDGEPLSGRTVTLFKTRGATSSPAAQVTTDSQGFYKATVAPTSNYKWSAEAGGAASEALVIGVMPRLTLNLSHSSANGRLYEHFSGKVTPAHRGSRVRVQSKTGAGWRTVAAGTLDARSRYRVTWALPHRTATYSLRVILPAHADHSQGTSPTAKLRVVFKQG